MRVGWSRGIRKCGRGEFPGWGHVVHARGDVTGKTLGLIGPGRIATAVARRTRVRDAAPLPRPPAQPELDALGLRRVPLEELLAESDFVSLHVPLSAETRHMIDAKGHWV